MGQIKKIGDQYYIEFYARGLMYSQVAGSTEGQAKKLLDEIELKISKGEALTIVREITLEIFFENFLENVKDKFSRKSLTRFTVMWKNFTQFLSGSYPRIKNLSQVTPSVVEDYKNSLIKTTRPKVLNLTILLLRELFEYGIKIGFLNDNPSLHVSLVKVDDHPLRKGRRFSMAQDLLSRSVTIGKVAEILKLKDIAQVMYWSKFIPIKREDVYN